MNNLPDALTVLAIVVLAVGLFAYLGRFGIMVREVRETKGSIELVMRSPMRNRVILRGDIREIRKVRTIDLTVEANPFRTKAVFFLPRREAILVRSNKGWINTWLFQSSAISLTDEHIQQTVGGNDYSAPPL